jgi:hypothetical protein
MRAQLGAIAGAVALSMAGAHTASAQPPATCTWGGTIVAPTGQNRVSTGLTNTPSTGPIRFHATGPLAGQCPGKLVFDGVMDAGASCAYITFHARTFGIPGVASVAGTSIGGFAPARLYDRHGAVVGSENANFLSDPSIALECNTAQGVTSNPFSSVIELFG